MPVLQFSIGIHRNDNILRDRRTCQWSPLDRDHGHWLIHLGVQNERLLARKHVVNADGTVECALGQVLIGRVVTNVESLSVEVAHGPLV